MRLVTRLLERLREDYRQQSEQQCFIAHEFDNLDIRARLSNALAAIHLQPYFADSEVTSDLMLGKICGKILATRAFIADVSSLNPNVYFELGLAVGFNKPVLAIVKDGKPIPPILDNFVHFRFTHYSGLEQELTRQMPVWFAGATESEALYTSHCHFLNHFCDDRNRLSPGRVFYLIDESNGAVTQNGPRAGVNPDLREAMLTAFKRFNFELALLDDVPASDDFRFCDFCRATRSASFGVINVSRRTAVSVYLFAGLLLGLGIGFLLLIQTPDEEGEDVIPPTLLRGLDYMTYRHFADLEERLPKQLEEFLNEQTKPLIDRVLIDLPLDDSVQPTGRVLTWKVMEAAADHAHLVQEQVTEMLLETFPRMLVYVYIANGADVVDSLVQYLYHALSSREPISDAFNARATLPRSGDNQSFQETMLEAFNVKSLDQISRKIEENSRVAGSSRKTIWIQHAPLRGSNNTHLDLGKYISWMDNVFISSLPESAHVVSQIFVYTRNPARFATYLGETLRSTHTAARSVIRIANDIENNEKSREYWEGLLFNETNCA